jgi:hypothetical protein
MMYLALANVGAHWPSTCRVIPMQVRAHYMRHLLRLDAHRGKAGEPILASLENVLAARPRLAAAGVDHDGVAAGAQHERVEAHDQLVVGAEPRRHGGTRLLEHRGCRVGQKFQHGKCRQFDLWHAADGEVAKRKRAHNALPPIKSQPRS